jgi:type IV pilus assembly protein PilB
MVRFVRKRLGDILLEAGVITEQQLEEVLQEQVTSRKRIGRLLIEKELITEEHLIDILERQLGISQVNLYNYNIDPKVASLIPMSLAQRYMVIPIGRKEQKIILAMADPMNIIALDDVAMITGSEIIPVIASESSVQHAINQIYGLQESLEMSLEDKKVKTKEDEEELARLRALVEDAPIVKVVNSLIHQAASEGASDIHIEPSGKGVRVRMRIDGILHDLMSPPKDTQPLIVSRIKIMANLDIAERRLPQDGRIQMQVGLNDINLRVSTMPTIHGEKVVIRLLEKDRVIVSLDKLGFNEHNFELYKQFLLNHSGMILVTGPTGCGKTTTLYSTLNYLNRPEDNIISVEDPVEYRLDGVNQIQVNPRINLNFANALRSILRQDPNIIMIGEIRDLETAEIATRAALTGHLVLSTLHTNDAVRAISRLIDMGVENYLITSSLVGVIAQRLVRLICPHCRESYALPDREKILFQKIFRKVPLQTLYRGAGCKSCNQTGYRGRIAIHEVLSVSPAIRRLVLAGATVEQLQRQALVEGMVTLLEDGRRRVEEGITSLEEILRVAFNSMNIDGESRHLEPAVEAVGAAQTAPEAPAVGLVPESGRLTGAGPEIMPGRAGLQQPPAREESSYVFNQLKNMKGAPVTPGVTAREMQPEKIITPAVAIKLKGPASAKVGETYTCHFSVINKGNVPLTGVTVTDSLFGEDWSYPIGELPPGAESAFVMNFTTDRGHAGSLENTATVTGFYRSTPVTAQDKQIIEIIDLVQPGLAIEISGPATAIPGETVVYKFTVTNSGSVPLKRVKVTDPLFGTGWRNFINAIAPGQSVKFNVEYTIPASAYARLKNTATASGWHEDEVTAQGSHTIEILSWQTGTVSR